MKQTNNVKGAFEQSLQLVSYPPGTELHRVTEEEINEHYMAAGL